MDKMDSCLDGITFVTGRAGTGKSTLLREFVAETDQPIAVTAPTGLAAINVRGQTIHSFFGIRPGPVMNDVEHVHQYSPRSMRGKILNRIEGLIIDEVSMVRADLFDAIDFSLRINRRSDAPFGGVKVFLFGDLLQLEPVVKRGAEQQMMVSRYESPFFFDSQVVREYGLDVIELTQVHRQASDPELLWALNELRRGNAEVLESFNERVGAELDESRLITLYTRNEGVTALNTLRLMELAGDGRRYMGVTEGDFLDEYPTDVVLHLKPGARVMFVKNGTEWVNGTLGTVVGIEEKSVWVELDKGGTFNVEPTAWEKTRYVWDDIRERISGEVVGTFTQLPLKLAWALTVHKSQGLTFDQVRLDFSQRAFAHGQLYVALSRCRTFPGLSLASQLKREDLVMNDRVMEFHSQLALT